MLTPLPSASKDDTDPYHASHVRHDPERKVVVCPQGRELPLQRMRQRGGQSVEVYAAPRSAKTARCASTAPRTGAAAPSTSASATPASKPCANWRQPGNAEYYQLMPSTIRNETLGWRARVYSIKQPALSDELGDALAALAERGEFREEGALKGFEFVEELVADAILDQVAEFFDRV